MLDARFLCIFHEPIRFPTKHLLCDNWLSTTPGKICHCSVCEISPIARDDFNASTGSGI